MSSVSQGPDLGGIHIAPALGENDIEKNTGSMDKQKGYIVEVALPIMLFCCNNYVLLNRSRKQHNHVMVYHGVGLVGLMRLNQAVYFWFK